MTDASSPPQNAAAIRAQLLDLITADLLGPAGGPNEIVDEPNVRDRYILGVLAPLNQAPQPAAGEDDEDDAGQGDTDQTDLPGAGDTDEDGPADPVPSRTPGMLPTSIGMTFTLDGAARAIRVAASWGRYTRIDNPDRDGVGQRGARRRVWQRTPLGGEIARVDLQEGELGPLSPVPEAPAVVIRGMVRRRRGDWIVTLYLTNAQARPAKGSGDGQDSAWIFQPELVVTCPHAEPLFTRRTYLRPQGSVDVEDLAMQMAYRDEVEFATGHGVAVQADLAPGRRDRAVRLMTRVVPNYEVGRVTPLTAEDDPALRGVELDMQALTAVPDGSFAAALSPLADAYAAWIDGQAGASTAPDLQPYADALPPTFAAMRRSLARMREGIALLDADPQAAAAFRFANEAMAMQRVRSVYTQRRRQGDRIAFAELDQPQNRSWYPFQLAFVLLNLPSLTDVRHPDRSSATEAVADLLWFPTGGGKTEAYLGLTAYTLGLRRLQGEMAGCSGLGVAVLMRYTLRLLTLQQFQRATALICACERIRLTAKAANDNRWGDDPFRIGLWVGSASTPNSTAAAAESLKRSSGGGRSTPYQLTTCPWCGSAIEPSRDLVVELGPQGRGRTLVYCGDPLGECPFSRRQAPGEGLPVVVVDEEIYRLLPALLIATVDKFAQLPWKGEIQMLFGRVTARCPRHGFCSPDLDCGTGHRRTADLPAVTKQPTKPLRPPDLIIQDELHLISGPLGTMVGLYETAIDELAEWQVGDQLCAASWWRLRPPSAGRASR